MSSRCPFSSTSQIKSIKAVTWLPVLWNNCRKNTVGNILMKSLFQRRRKSWVQQNKQAFKFVTGSKSVCEPRPSSNQITAPILFLTWRLSHMETEQTWLYSTTQLWSTLNSGKVCLVWLVGIVLVFGKVTYKPNLFFCPHDLFLRETLGWFHLQQLPRWSLEDDAGLSLSVVSPW